MAEVKAQGCKVCPTSYLTHIPFIQCQSTLIPEIWLFENLTMKTRSMLWGRSNIQITKWVWLPHPFRSMSIGHPIYEIWLFKIWPQKSKDKIRAEGHTVGPPSYWLTSLLFHVNQHSHSRHTAFLKIWPWKSKVKVMGEVKVWSHKVSATSYWLRSLVNRPSQSWEAAFPKFELESVKSRS